ncbi:ATP-dependent dethiobiotin synthetase BioD [Shewanella sp. KT0246]|nr:ATP-dependent dethiobiotin synthetase BioD [Shewanella sp. KT0246]
MIYFITGTDTDSGKTLVSSALLHGAKGNKMGVKPIASGCEQTENGLRNSDALALIAESNIKLEYHQINPVAFKPAIAPHIAAMQQGVMLTAQGVVDTLPLTELANADFALIEGAGGWRLPLGNGEYLSDSVKLLAMQQQVGIILVVGMKLGCLNHALLTQEAILSDGLKIVGWVANQVDPDMAYQDENLATLKQMMSSDFLGYVAHLSNPNAKQAAQFINF